MKRRLAAILVADVVGFSTMMGADEARALAAIRLLREEVFEPDVERWNGVVVKRLGDGWIVEFPSVIDAVSCALAVQIRMQKIQDLDLRIGIHIGDILLGRYITFFPCFFIPQFSFFIILHLSIQTIIITI